MNMIDKLRAAIANLSELREEKKGLEERRAKAQAEISAAANDKITDKIEARISRASNVVTVCGARLARLEAGSQSEANELCALYEVCRDAWNLACARRRELCRASFLNACLPHFDNSEAITAERLAGIMPLPLVRASRAGWNLMPHPNATPFDILQQVETFIGHVQRHSEENGIPIE